MAAGRGAAARRRGGSFGLIVGARRARSCWGRGGGVDRGTGSDAAEQDEVRGDQGRNHDGDQRAVGTTRHQRILACGPDLKGHSSQSRSRNRPAASARLRTPSLWRTLLTWLSTVRGEITRAAAISRSVSPSARRRRTSFSRALRLPRPRMVGVDGPRVPGGDESPDQAGGHPRRHREVAVPGGAHPGRQLLRAQVLGEVPHRTVADGLHHVAVGARDREHHDAGLGQARRKLPDQLDAAHPRQVDVHEHDVRPRLEGKVQCLLGARRLRDQLHVRRRDGLPHRGSNKGVVVDEHDPQLPRGRPLGHVPRSAVRRRSAAMGTVTRTCGPILRARRR